MNVKDTIADALPDTFHESEGNRVVGASSDDAWVFKQKYHQRFLVVKKAGFSSGQEGFLVDYWYPEAGETRENKYDSGPRAKHQSQEVATSIRGLSETIKASVEELEAPVPAAP
jgi:hypothetical protein